MKRILTVLLFFIAHAALADYVGDVKLGTTLEFEFDTYKSTDGSDLQRTAAGTPSCVPNGSTTEVTAGVTDTGTSAFDSVTGLNKITIVATVANGYAKDTNYVCGFRASTLNGVTVSSANVISFSVENRAPLKGLILARGVLAAGSTTSVANIGAALTFNNQFVTRVIENTDTGEQQCITASTDSGSNDSVTFSPNVPTAWSTSANWVIYNGVPCFPVNLPAVSGAGGVYVAGIVSAGTADFDSDIGTNMKTFFKNGGVLTSFKLGDIATSFSTMPASIWGYAIDGYTARCTLAANLSILAGGFSTVTGTTTYKDTSNVNTRVVGTVTNSTRGPSAITCPP